MFTFVAGILNVTLFKNISMKPTLFVLAAGMGSRYGGLKQLDGLGPNGETIMITQFMMQFAEDSENWCS